MHSARSYIRQVRSNDCTIHFQSIPFLFYIIQGDVPTYFPYISSYFPCVSSEKHIVIQYFCIIFHILLLQFSLFGKNRIAQLKIKVCQIIRAYGNQRKEINFFVQSVNSLFLEKIFSLICAFFEIIY